jgi:repressor LexA
MRPIHPLQQKLLNELRRLSGTDEGYTYRDLMKKIGASSTSQVSHHLTQLEQKGLLKRDPDNSQDFTLIDEAEDAFSFLPLLALASCGKGLENEQHVIERIPVRSSFIPTQIKDTFLILADGDSMKPRINHKDIVLVEKYSEGKHNPLGKVVVCEENSECKIKQYSKSGGDIVLVSFNEKYPPYVVKNPDNFKIHGIVRGVLFASL